MCIRRHRSECSMKGRTKPSARLTEGDLKVPTRPARRRTPESVSLRLSHAREDAHSRLPDAPSSYERMTPGMILAACALAMRRLMLMSFILYVVLDLANPFPGTIAFEPEESIVESDADEEIEEPTRLLGPHASRFVAAALRSANHDARPHTSQVAQARHVASDWLAVSHAHAAAPPPPPASEDH